MTMVTIMIMTSYYNAINGDDDGDDDGDDNDDDYDHDKWTQFDDYNHDQ